MANDFYCEALLKALELEEQGKKFYEEALVKVKDPFARKALEFLVEEEKRHIEKILKFNDYLFGRSDFDFEVECKVQVGRRLKELIETHVTERVLKKLDEAKSDLEVYKIAMEFEKRGYDFYKSSEEKEEDDRIKKFFKFLQEEEVKHYSLLQETVRYLSEPDYYFEDFGGWIFG